AKRRRATPASLAQEIAEVFRRPQAVGPVREILETALAQAAAPPLFPDAAPVLRQLRTNGFRVYALTNCLGSSVPAQEPEFHGLLDAVLCSADTGWCKPEREAFATVEELSGLEPGQLLHVGDSLRADVAGATAAGWHAAYLRRPGGQQASAVAGLRAVTITTLHDLIPRLPGLT
ncbi:MAG: HAD family hydrolase, partial [Streptosporangiaceae bacterium]